MSYPAHIWQQIKNITADEFISALKRDHFVEDLKAGSKRVYYHNDGRRVAIDYHPRKTFGPNLLKALFTDTGWSPADLKRLKLVK